jgi:hypothetical protein
MDVGRVVGMLIGQKCGAAIEGKSVAELPGPDDGRSDDGHGIGKR